MERYHDIVKKKKTFFLIKVGLITSICIAVLVSFVYIFLFSSTFKIHHITIEGVHTISTKQITAAANTFMGQNIFFVSDTYLLKKFPLIASIQVQKSYPDSLLLFIHEYPPFVLVQTTQKTYVYSQYGILIQTIANNNTKYESLPLITTQGAIKSLPLTSTLQFISFMANQPDQFVSVYMYIPNETIEAIYADGYSVYFSLQKSYSDQLTIVRNIKKYLGVSKCKILDVRYEHTYCTPE